MRAMASIRQIDSIDPIEGADAIEVATVGGWRVVVKKGEFFPGDVAIYCEIDSWIPHELAPFLSKGKEPREYNGVKGERLKTIRLRGQLSQGLLLPLQASWVIRNLGAPPGSVFTDYVGIDVTEKLGIQKWEAPIPAQLAGKMKGYFPSFLRKTDQERVQNLKSELSEMFENEDTRWEITEKLDGSSMTVYVRDDVAGVCSRNLDLVEDDNNSFWKVAKEYGVIDKIRSTGRNLAIQGELVGEGIQGNPYKLQGLRFYVFDIYDINAGEYMGYMERQDILDKINLESVPILFMGLVDKNITMEMILDTAEGESLLTRTEREGVVFKRADGLASFKSISNAWLLKGGN